MKVKIKDAVTAEGKKFEKLLEDLGKLEVRVGIQQSNKKGDGGSKADLVDIAMFNEFGTESIPSRPFLRDSVDANGDKINNFLQAMKQEILNGSSAEDILKEIGAFQKGLIQEQILEGNYEENKEPYKSRKERKHPPAVPLIDSGRMRQSINFVIREKGGSG